LISRIRDVFVLVRRGFVKPEDHVGGDQELFQLEQHGGAGLAALQQRADLAVKKARLHAAKRDRLLPVKVSRRNAADRGGGVSVRGHGNAPRPASHEQGCCQGWTGTPTPCWGAEWLCAARA